MEYNDGDAELYSSPQFVTEYSFPKKEYLTIGKPRTSADYLKFQSEDYIRYKLDEKIKNRVNGLNIGDQYIKEICEMCYYHYKQEKVRISDVIAIVCYKVIKKYNLPIAHNEIFEKICLDKGRYLKYAKLIVLPGEKRSAEVGKDSMLSTSDVYGSKVSQYLNFLVNQLAELFKFKPHSFKIQTEKINLDDYLRDFDKLGTKSDYVDNLKLLDEVKQQAKELIFNHSYDTHHELNFREYFSNKVLTEVLAAGLIKYLMDKKGVKIKLQIFKENFKISISGISKVMKMIEEYIKLIIV